jgi:hypothetical protein
VCGELMHRGADVEQQHVAVLHLLGGAPCHGVAGVMVPGGNLHV